MYRLATRREMVPAIFSCSIFSCVAIETRPLTLPIDGSTLRHLPKYGLPLGALYDALHPLSRTRNVLRCVVGASCKCRLGIHQMGDVARASCTGIEGEGAPTRARRRYFHCLVDTRLAIGPIPFYGIVHIQ